MKRLVFVWVFVWCFATVLFPVDLRLYGSPDSVFFSDAIGLGATLGVEVELGVSKLSSCDVISVSPEVSFAFSQSEGNYFSCFSFKVVPSYLVMLHSFEKKNTLFLRIGLGAGVSLPNVSAQSVMLSGVGVVLEPLVGLLYNFSGSLWVGLELRYSVLGDMENRITSSLSPKVVVPFSVQFQL